MTACRWPGDVPRGRGGRLVLQRDLFAEGGRGRAVVPLPSLEHEAVYQEAGELGGFKGSR